MENNGRLMNNVYYIVTVVLLVLVLLTLSCFNHISNNFV